VQAAPAKGTDHNCTIGVAFMAVAHDIAGSLRSNCLPGPVRLRNRIGWFLAASQQGSHAVTLYRTSRCEDPFSGSTWRKGPTG
jgi:hypothetical protein